MGGRGTFAIGKKVDYTYRTVGEIEGVKVLEGINGKHSLPESSHSSLAYIKLYKDGTFHEMRLYNENRVLYLEIAYHREKNLTGNNTEKILHYHTYDPNFSKTNIQNKELRSEAKHITPELYKKYKKYFKGVKL